MDYKPVALLSYPQGSSGIYLGISVYIPDYFFEI